MKHIAQTLSLFFICNIINASKPCYHFTFNTNKEVEGFVKFVTSTSSGPKLFVSGGIGLKTIATPEDFIEILVSTPQIPGDTIIAPGEDYYISEAYQVKFANGVIDNTQPGLTGSGSISLPKMILTVERGGSIIRTTVSYPNDTPANQTSVHLLVNNGAITPRNTTTTFAIPEKSSTTSDSNVFATAAVGVELHAKDLTFGFLTKVLIDPNRSGSKQHIAEAFTELDLDSLSYQIGTSYNFDTEKHYFFVGFSSRYIDYYAAKNRST